MEERIGSPLWYIVFVCVLLIGGFLLWHYEGGKWATAKFTPPSEIELGSVGTGSWYSLSGNTLKSISGPTVALKNKFLVFEVGNKISAGTPVLGSARVGIPPHDFGIITVDGILQLPLSDTTEKRGVADTAKGLVVFAYNPSLDAGSGFPWHVGLVDTQAAAMTVKDLGAGYAPVFSSDTTILAVAPEGLVSIEVSGTRTALLPFVADFSLPVAIAPDASFAILPNTLTKTDDVFFIQAPTATGISYLTSLPAPPRALSVFPGGFIAQTGNTTADLYSVSSKGATLVQALTIVKQ